MRLRLRAVLLFALMCFAHASFAQNLLTNPDLTADIAGWLKSNSTSSSGAGWDDRTGFPTPGSGLLMANLAGDVAWIQQCVNISPQNVDLAGWSKGVFTSSPNHGAGLALAAHDVPNCAQPHIQYAVAPLSGTALNGWFEHRLINHMLPPGTQSVSVLMIGNVSTFSVVVNFDYLAFGPTGTAILNEVVFKNDFEG